MVFTGYKFLDRTDIDPYTERAGEGPTFEWCSKQAKRLGCWVFCGYPEKVLEGETYHYYNSQVVVNPQGDFVKSYKKHFLYETDESWAEEGPSFDTLDLKIPRLECTIKIGNAICMDINPYEYKADPGLYEFANFH